jgi:hypothetical protein
MSKICGNVTGRDIMNMSYWERHNEYETMAFRIGPTRVAFVNSLKEYFYSIRNNDDYYTRWTMTLRHERD